MNTQLEKLFERYNVSEKDKYEIRQIYGLLPMQKQQNILNNFELLYIRLEQTHKEIDLERRILVGDLFEDIKAFYEKYGEKIGTL